MHLFRLAIAFVTILVCACNSPEQPPSKPASNKPAEKTTPIPETIILETSEGRITLPHLAHAKRLHCAMRHSEITSGQIAWDKDTSHAYCRDCHKTQGRGPTACTGCHKQ